MVLAGIGEGIGKALTKIFGSRNQRVLEDMTETVEEINGFEPYFESLSDEQLMAQTEQFRKRLKEDESLDELLPEAFAAVRESSKRHNPKHERHYDVQMIGGIVLHRGAIAEMVTGEGKTLVATLAAYLNALPGDGVHVITVNDYLATRDRDWMAPVFEGLGMTCGVVYHGMDGPGNAAARKAAYDADITYGTNSQFGFDYLYDNMKPRLELLVQRGHHFAIVDEVDSILIDEARTPLIISGEAEESTDKYYAANRAAKKLKVGEHYEVKEKERQVVLSDEGIDKAEAAVGVGSFYDAQNMEWPHLINQALVANNLYKRDQTHVVKEGEVIIVDEFTGRMMPGRRWSDGLHQAVEAMEGIRIREEQQTLATVTIQNYFRQYKKLSGMTGTAITEAEEFMKIYRLDVIVIPTNKPLRRLNHPDHVYATEKEKFEAIIDTIEELHDEGRPVLVGTVSIANSEKIAGMLKRRGVEHEVLNAKHHEREAVIVAKAGQLAHVTIATNMAGRGTDIELGDGVTDLGGLAILGTERHDSRRIDNQLRGRAGRQGDPGSSMFFLSLEDTLMARFAKDWVKRFLQKMGMTDGQEITSKLLTRQIEGAQSKVEEYNFAVRKNLLEYDEVMDAQRKSIYGQRSQILHSIEIQQMTEKMVKETLFDEIDTYLSKDSPPEEWDHNGLAASVKSTFGIETDGATLSELKFEEVEKNLTESVMQAFTHREKELTRIGEEAGYEENFVESLQQFLMLQTIDRKWKEHLRFMDFLRSSVGLRGYAQKDPKVEYKREGFETFSQMLTANAKEVTEMLFKVTPAPTSETDGLRASGPVGTAVHQRFDVYNATPEDDGRTAGGAHSGERPQPIRRSDKKVGRNDPCPCGSGKKHKACCGK